MSLEKTLKGVDPNRITSIGLDVSKDKISICFMTSLQNVFYEIENNSQGIDAFCLDVVKTNISKEVPYVLESTGDYHLMLAIKLSKAGFNTKEINPIITHHYVKHSIRGTKTDKTDAEMLGKIGIIEGEKIKRFDRSERFIELKKKVKLIASLEKHLQAITASITGYKKTFKKLGFEISLGVDSIESTLKTLKDDIKNLEKEIEEYEFNEEETKKISCIDSIKGISTYIAKVCFIEFANLEFKSKESMLAYVGLDPKLKQSGEKNIGIRLSKRGSSYARKKLFQGGFCGIRHSVLFKSIYDRALKNGKHHCEGVVMVMKKIIYIMRSLLKNGTMFNENYVRIVP